MAPASFVPRSSPSVVSRFTTSLTVSAASAVPVIVFVTDPSSQSVDSSAGSAPATTSVSLSAPRITKAAAPCGPSPRTDSRKAWSSPATTGDDTGMAGHVREATVDDARSIAEVHVRIWQETYVGQVPQEYLDGLSVESREARWRESLGDQPEPRQVCRLSSTTPVRSLRSRRRVPAETPTPLSPSAKCRRSICGRARGVAGGGER